MKQNDIAEFSEKIIATYETYSKQLSDSAVKMMFRALSNYSIEQVTQGITAHVRDTSCGMFPPTPAHIIEKIDGGNVRTLAAGAWVKVRQAVSSVGAYQTVIFDDPLIHAAIGDIGGWTHLCSQLTEDNEPFKQKEFVSTYERRKAQGYQNYPRKLIGITEAHNQKHGVDTTPMLVGDRQACIDVYKQGSIKAIGLNSLAELSELEGIGNIEKVTEGK